MFKLKSIFVTQGFSASAKLDITSFHIWTSKHKVFTSLSAVWEISGSVFLNKRNATQTSKRLVMRKLSACFKLWHYLGFVADNPAHDQTETNYVEKCQDSYWQEEAVVVRLMVKPAHIARAVRRLKEGIICKKGSKINLSLSYDA